MVKKVQQYFVREEVEVFGSYDGGTLEDVLARIKECVDKVPEEYRSSVEFELETRSEPYDTKDYPVFNMSYHRLENEEEKNKRESKETAIRKMQEDHERKEYERLQKKFGK